MACTAASRRFHVGGAEIPKACLLITRCATCSLVSSAAPVVVGNHDGAHVVQLDNWVKLSCPGP